VKTLHFAEAASLQCGRRVRRVQFKSRPSLPVSAACVVANAMRETLSTLTNAPVDVRLLEPLVPDIEAWRAIARDAWMVRVPGGGIDAAIVLRPKDGVALASLLFAETDAAERSLSVVERTVVGRSLQALAGSLAPVCGFRETPLLEPILDISGYATYFEVLVEQPVHVRVGIALARDPVPAPAGPRIRPEDLADVELDLRVELAHGTLDAAALLALGEGAYVPMTSRVGDDGVLLAGTTVVARGECGAQDSRAAMIVRLPANGVLR